ncbi:putative translational regulatory protein ArgL [Kosakonia cowanii]
MNIHLYRLNFNSISGVRHARKKCHLFTRNIF